MDKTKWLTVISNPGLDKHMSLTFHPRSVKDGEIVVCPTCVMDNGSDIWADCVVGYFLDKRTT